jgi:hypothetical protein
MNYTVSMQPGYLLAELVGRQTAEETTQFLKAAHAAVLEQRASRVLLWIRSSRAIFKVEEYRLNTMIDIAMDLRLRIALASDSTDVFLSHQYVEMLAKQRGLPLRAFRDDKAALEWLLEDAAPRTARLRRRERSTSRS